MGKNIELADIEHGQYLSLFIRDEHLVSGRVTIQDGQVILCQNKAISPNIHKLVKAPLEKHGYKYAMVLFDRYDEDMMLMFTDSNKSGDFKIEETTKASVDKRNGKDSEPEEALGVYQDGFVKKLRDQMILGAVDDIKKSLEDILDSSSNEPEAIKDMFDKVREKYNLPREEEEETKKAVVNLDKLLEDQKDKIASIHSEAGEYLAEAGFLEGIGPKVDMVELVNDTLLKDKTATAYAMAILQYLHMADLLNEELIHKESTDGQPDPASRAMVTMVIMLNHLRGEG